MYICADIDNTLFDLLEIEYRVQIHAMGRSKRYYHPKLCEPTNPVYIQTFHQCMPEASET